jgi:hypothetical protein
LWEAQKPPKPVWLSRPTSLSRREIAARFREKTGDEAALIFSAYVR